MPPVSVYDLHNGKIKRNIWVQIDNNEPWSCTGCSHKQKALDNEITDVTAGMLWFKTTRKHASGQIVSEITTFSPIGKDLIETSRVNITNTGDKSVSIQVTPAIPLYGRSADSLRDHRHVTSLLNSAKVTQEGIILQPTMSFDERGHKVNTTIYGTLGVDSKGDFPIGAYPNLDEFIGEAGDGEKPEALFNKDYGNTVLKVKGDTVNGFEALGALTFKPVDLEPGQSYSVVIISGVFKNEEEVSRAFSQLGSVDKFNTELENTRKYWVDQVNTVDCNTGNKDYNNWMKWVSLQPILRRIYGCSFLPYHDYGRGGRGWRDLWQDCLALLLMEPQNVRGLLLSNFLGVRFDGTNATIIGSEPGSFLADRNSISRVWMDHGAWPLLTLRLYLDQSGDIDFMFEEQGYFSDSQWARATERRENLIQENNRLKSVDGNEYTGTVIEHILLQHLTVFYNVGDNNSLLLEGADWNDGLDMADEKGESVAFSSFYAGNLLWLADFFEKAHNDSRNVELAEEILVLLDRYTGNSKNYNSPFDKQAILKSFYTKCKNGPSGKKVKIDPLKLSMDLRAKGISIQEHIRANEWIKSQSGNEWFNGYYDNNGKRVEGDFNNVPRMTLTGQVFALLSGTATDEQVEKVLSSAKKYLWDKKVGGYRLNTNFNELKLDMGRCFGFAYGHKENGAMFSHMAIMFGYALYERNKPKEGWELLKTMFNASVNFETSRMFPGLPEYFDSNGRGLYSYLTGSASWYLLTVITRMFGVRGEWGDLVLDPKLVLEQWGSEESIGISTYFRGVQIKVNYYNPLGLEIGSYQVDKIYINQEEVNFTLDKGARIIASNLPKESFSVKVVLGKKE